MNAILKFTVSARRDIKERERIFGTSQLLKYN